MRRMNRREFLKAGAGGAMAFGPGIRGWAQGSPRKAVVIGHTGRGDYGHGLEAIFQNRPGIVLAGLAAVIHLPIREQPVVAPA